MLQLHWYTGLQAALVCGAALKPALCNKPFVLLLFLAHCCSLHIKECSKLSCLVIAMMLLFAPLATFAPHIQ